MSHELCKHESQIYMHMSVHINMHMSHGLCTDESRTIGYVRMRQELSTCESLAGYAKSAHNMSHD